MQLYHFGTIKKKILKVYFCDVPSRAQQNHCSKMMKEALMMKDWNSLQSRFFVKVTETKSTVKKVRVLKLQKKKGIKTTISLVLLKHKKI